MTLNDLADASLAVLGRERMESTKRRSSLAWLIVVLLTGLLSLGIAGPATSALPAQGEAALAQLKERGLYDSLQEALATARYGVYPEQPHLATWQAENPAQQLRARFTAEGVQVEAWPWRCAAHRHEAAQRRLRGAADRGQRGSADEQR